MVQPNVNRYDLSQFNQEPKGCLPKNKFSLVRKDNRANRDYLSCQSIIIDKYKKYSIDEDKLRIHRHMAQKSQKSFHTYSLSKIDVKDKVSLKQSLKKIRQVQKKSSSSTKYPHQQKTEQNQQQWFLKCSQILRDLKNSRISFNNKSRQKQSIFQRIKSLHRQFNKRKNNLMQNRNQQPTNIQSLKQEFSSGIICNRISPLCLLSSTQQKKVQNKDLKRSQVKMVQKKEIERSRYKDIPIFKFIYEKQDQYNIKQEFRQILQKSTRKLQLISKRKNLTQIQNYMTKQKIKIDVK